MPRYDFHSPRLYVNEPLSTGLSVPLDRPQTNYLLNVLRLSAGDSVLAFNARDGEWRGLIEVRGKREAVLALEGQTRQQTTASNLHYLFAPLKHARLDYMVQKAVELGVSRLQPVLTRHAQVSRINGERMRANAIEAAEQCGVLTLPDIGIPVGLEQALAAIEPKRLLVFCDEAAEVRDPIAALAAFRPAVGEDLPLAVLIGPEGGFSADERERLLQRPNLVRIALGPRILRADTAAVAALSLVQAVLGDWRG